MYTIILLRTNEMNTHVVYSTTRLIILIWQALKIAFACSLTRFLQSDVFQRTMVSCSLSPSLKFCQGMNPSPSRAYRYKVQCVNCSVTKASTTPQRSVQ